MRKSYPVALGGVLAALAVTIMALGGMIPIATYVCPMLCSLLLFTVLQFCGKRIAWTWYCAVSVLCLLLSPDKEAAMVFLLLGYYPIVQPYLDRSPLRWLWKAFLFNGAAAVLYLMLIYVFGMQQVVAEFRELGIAGLLITLILGNVCFFLLDRLLHILKKKTVKR